MSTSRAESAITSERAGCHRAMRATASAYPREAMAEVRVTVAREADVPAIERLAALAPVHLAPAADWHTIVSALGAVVARTDGRLAGVLVLWPHPDHVRIERLVVDPAARGGGAGRTMLDHAELVAIETGTNVVRLVPDAVTPGVVAFAERNGFARSGPVLEKRLV